MKQQLSAAFCLVFMACALPAGAQPSPSTPPPVGVRPPRPEVAPPASTNDYSKIFKDDKERNGYAIGLSSGSRLMDDLKRNDVDFDIEALLQGLKDGAMGANGKINMEQDREIMGLIRRDLQAHQAEKQKLAQAKMKAEGEKNRKDGDAFLAAKKQEAGVIPLPSGLMYKIIAEGSGDSPKANDTVTVNYRGTLIDGTEFDSSAKTGKPASFRVSGVIPGWTEALQLMKPGAKWQLFIPGDLAYGERGHPPSIPPSATLVFDVELVSVQAAPPPPPAPAPGAPLTSDIIKVPSAEELKKGAKIETIKAEDIEKERLKEAAKTNN